MEDYGECDECVSQFNSFDGCDAWRDGDFSQISMATSGCHHCSHVMTEQCPSFCRIHHRIILYALYDSFEHRPTLPLLPLNSMHLRKLPLCKIMAFYSQEFDYISQFARVRHFSIQFMMESFL